MDHVPAMDDPSPASRFAGLPGFGPGVEVMTSEGELPIEWLATGDKIITRDHGAQPVLWIGRARIDAAGLRRRPGLRPVEIAADALGAGLPAHNTWLAPRTRVLLAGGAVELHAGATEALAQVRDLEDGARVRRPPRLEGIFYTCLLLPMHAVVQANGLWAETLLLDGAARQALRPELPLALASAPELRAGHALSARLCLADWEVAAMRGGRAGEAIPGLIHRAA